jgi:hypothetical protein
MRTTRPRISVCTAGRPGRRFGFVRFRTISSRCQRSRVSGRTMVATSVRIGWPSRAPSRARRRRSASDRRTRRPRGCAFSTRFSALRYSITSCCSPAIQRTSAVSIRCSGNIRESLSDQCPTTILDSTRYREFPQRDCGHGSIGSRESAAGAGAHAWRDLRRVDGANLLHTGDAGNRWRYGAAARGVWHLWRDRVRRVAATARSESGSRWARSRARSGDCSCVEA